MFANFTIVCLIILIAGIWYDSMAARERANLAAREICTQKGLSLLDGTVALAKRQLIFAAGGRLSLRRTYTFDYCEDPFSRLSGFVILHGHRIESVGLASADAEA